MCSGYEAPNWNSVEWSKCWNKISVVCVQVDWTFFPCKLTLLIFDDWVETKNENKKIIAEPIKITQRNNKLNVTKLLCNFL